MSEPGVRQRRREDAAAVAGKTVAASMRTLKWRPKLRSLSLLFSAPLRPPSITVGSESLPFTIPAEATNPLAIAPAGDMLFIAGTEGRVMVLLLAGRGGPPLAHLSERLPQQERARYQDGQQSSYAYASSDHHIGRDKHPLRSVCLTSPAAQAFQGCLLPKGELWPPCVYGREHHGLWKEVSGSDMSTSSISSSDNSNSSSSSEESSTKAEKEFEPERIVESRFTGNELKKRRRHLRRRGESFPISHRLHTHRAGSLSSGATAGAASSTGRGANISTDNNIIGGHRDYNSNRDQLLGCANRERRSNMRYICGRFILRLPTCSARIGGDFRRHFTTWEQYLTDSSDYSSTSSGDRDLSALPGTRGSSDSFDGASSPPLPFLRRERSAGARRFGADTGGVMRLGGNTPRLPSFVLPLHRGSSSPWPAAVATVQNNTRPQGIPGDGNTGTAAATTTGTTGITPAGSRTTFTTRSSIPAGAGATTTTTSVPAGAGATTTTTSVPAGAGATTSGTTNISTNSSTAAIAAAGGGAGRTAASPPPTGAWVGNVFATVGTPTGGTARVLGGVVGRLEREESRASPRGFPASVQQRLTQATRDSVQQAQGLWGETGIPARLRQFHRRHYHRSSGQRSPRPGRRITRISCEILAGDEVLVCGTWEGDIMIFSLNAVREHLGRLRAAAAQRKAAYKQQQHEELVKQEEECLKEQKRILQEEGEEGGAKEGNNNQSHPDDGVEQLQQNGSNNNRRDDSGGYILGADLEYRAVGGGADTPPPGGSYGDARYQRNLQIRKALINQQNEILMPDLWLL